MSKKRYQQAKTDTRNERLSHPRPCVYINCSEKAGAVSLTSHEKKIYMPLCLIQSLPGTRYSLTNTLTVVIPVRSAQISEGVSPLYQKEVREGRVSWHTDSESPHDGQPFSFETLAVMCKEWREQGVFSFVEVRLSGEIGETEKNHLHRLKQISDWLILDATSEIGFLPEALRIEGWGHQALCMKEIGKKVGLRLAVDSQLPASVLFPWIAKVVLELSAPGFLFLEGESTEKVAAIIRGVQDILFRHPLSKDAARLIPILRTSSHKLGEKIFESLDFSSLDALLIESCRPFFGGMAVRQEQTERLFSLSLWNVVVKMISERRSSASFLEHSVDGLAFIPEGLRLPFVRGVYDLFFWVSREDRAKIAIAKADIEAAWGQITKEMQQGGEKMRNAKAVVDAVIGQCHETSIAANRTSKIGSFFNSMSEL
jgi:hypothetical protein